MPTTAIWWIRRDLRLHDNQALASALENADHVLPLFILDPTLLNSRSVGQPRKAFLFNALRSLDADLRARGSQLLVRSGNPDEVLQDVMAESSATFVYAEADYSPYAIKRDAMIAYLIPTADFLPGITVRHPTDVTKKAGGYYTVFTPFKKAWLKLPLPRRQQLLDAPDGDGFVSAETITTLACEQIPELDSSIRDNIFPASEAEARRRLADFTRASLFRYNEVRDRMDIAGTSALSPYLRFGMISARAAIVAALDAVASTDKEKKRENAEVWLSELIWREFYQMILYHYPRVRSGSFRPEYDRIQWRNDPYEFAAWKKGETGYPIVDAAMRQLLHTGWMHNRARMIVASFLTKDLLIDWRWGEQWFMERLIDGDNAANNGGWQWAAGTGTDAAPYFRIFNPTSQGKKFDPKGTYVRRWVPELTKVPDKFIHEPGTLPPFDRKISGVEVGLTYPSPIVNHKWAREATLAAYKAARESE